MLLLGNLEVFKSSILSLLVKKSACCLGLFVCLLGLVLFVLVFSYNQVISTQRIRSKDILWQGGNHSHHMSTVTLAFFLVSFLYCVVDTCIKLYSLIFS